MPFDANLVLVDGSVDLIPTTDTAPTSTTRDATTGAAVIDLGTTVRPRGGSEGAIHLTATLILPSAPTTYADTLTVTVEQSDDAGNAAAAWETIGAFPVLYALTRLLSITVTTAFVAADIAETLTGGTTGDTGVIRWMHPDLYTIGNTANMIVAMVGADDLFDDVDEAVSSGGTGVGTMNGAGVVEAKPRLSGPNTFTRGFSVTKRYVRGNLTVSTGGNFGAVQMLLSPYPFRRI